MDAVVGYVNNEPCPWCNKCAIAYNGNYNCTNCDWRMTHDVPRIIKAYLEQCRDKALNNGDIAKAERMSFHLADYL